MELPEVFQPLSPFLDEPQVRLIRVHLERLPRPRQAANLLARWAQDPGLPAEPSPFLHLLYLASLSEALFFSLHRRTRLLRSLDLDIRAAVPLGIPGMEEGLARFILQERQGEIESKLAAFRAFQTSRILVQETLGVLSFEETVQELSALADVLISRAFMETHQPLREELGLPLMAAPDGRRVACNLAVFALGKHGGGELNYSSDVDLVYFFEKEGTTDRGTKNAAFFGEWIRSAPPLLNQPTPDGPSLRIDSNLRPRGRDGELTLSFDAALAYYGEWADAWERQAWIKARPCAGNLEAGRRFLVNLQRIVYRPYAFSGIASQNRKMRKQAEQKLESRRPGEAGQDIKEGHGAIRDVEFAVQALQMAHGQKDRWIREPGTLLAMAKLGQKGHLLEGEQGELSRAYILLRRAEHWSQFGGMRQCHTLPQSGEEWEAMARYLGFSSADVAQDTIRGTREAILGLFNEVLSRLSKSGDEVDEVDRLLSSAGMRDVLERGRLPDPDRAMPLLSAIYRSFEPHLTNAKRRENFLRIHYSLQREFAEVQFPYLGLQGLYRLIPTLQTDSALFRRILDRPRPVRLLFRLAAQSEPLFEMIQRWPYLVTSLSYEDLRNVARKVAGLARADSLEELRKRQKEALFLLGVRTLWMKDDLNWAHRQYSKAATAVLRRVFELVSGEIEEGEGLERGLLGDRLCLIGLGRFGLREMHPRSDLDLVLLKGTPWLLEDDADRSARLEDRVLKRLAGALTEVTRYGALYPVDFALRPYGNSGPLVPAADALEAYFKGPAELWERIAWLKARPVAGNLEVGRSALERVWEASFERGIPPEKVRRLSELRDRLHEQDRSVEGEVKFAPGGLMELDFLLLCLQIRHRILPRPGGTPELLNRIRAGAGLDPDLVGSLYRARLFQDGLLFRIRRRYLRPPHIHNVAGVLETLSRPILTSMDELGPEPQYTQEGFPQADRDELTRTWRDHQRAVGEGWELFRQITVDPPPIAMERTDVE